MTATSVTVREAAALTGRSKQGILKSIHNGRLSASRGDNQEWLIEGAELARVFEVSPTNYTGNGDNHGEPSGPEVSSRVQGELDGCRDKVTMLERIIRDKDETIADLRQRLDAFQAASEQSQAQVSQLTAVIAQLQPAKAKVGWWQRLLGGA